MSSEGRRRQGLDIKGRMVKGSLKVKFRKYASNVRSRANIHELTPVSANCLYSYQALEQQNNIH